MCTVAIGQCKKCGHVDLIQKDTEKKIKFTIKRKKIQPRPREVGTLGSYWEVADNFWWGESTRRGSEKSFGWLTALWIYFSAPGRWVTSFLPVLLSVPRSTLNRDKMFDISENGRRQLCKVWLVGLFSRQVGLTCGSHLRTHLERGGAKHIQISRTWTYMCALCFADFKSF